MMKRARGAIGGIVQGVGFRPFIYQLARRYRLRGFVANTSEGVELEVEGPEKDIESFFAAIRVESPPLARISYIQRTNLPLKKDPGFEIRSSRGGGERATLISPDVSVCDDCLSELNDPQDRRFGYPFINCTHCGPRYTIITDIPYDRVMTTMKVFKMCPVCRSEYEDPDSRRFHAQPNACRECGPRLCIHDGEGQKRDGADPVRKAISLLKEGRILAVKGLGGFHLAVDAADHRAVLRLRRRKHREEKPLALMVKDLESAKAIAHINEEEAVLLLSPQRPIVLLRKRRFHGLSSQVSPKNRDFGLMLPYTPLHHLLMAGGFRALVMTSGNMTEEPIHIENRAAFQNLRGIADAFLVHDRGIYLRSDDSIVRSVDHVPRQIRRSRGYVPVPIPLSEDMKDLPSVLGLGAELKNTVCLTRGRQAFVSQHIGDMENLETFDFFTLTLSHLRRILEICPRVLAHDLHPDYLSTKFALDQEEIPRISVQHHHAHIVSCLAENRITGPVIGLALDGTGLGPDGRIWGGEILLADRGSFKRAAHLEYMALPGGDAAARFPWRTALSVLYRAYGREIFDLPLAFIRGLDPNEAEILLRMIRRRIQAPLTSSCGRLFDAVSALIGLRSKIAYEGQAAVELEMCQSMKEKGGYPWDIQEGEDTWVMLTSPMIKAVVEDLKKGTRPGVISRRFHLALIDMFAGMCMQIREESGLNRVALSGGAFQNATLLSGITHALESKGFEVYSHRRVPTNDGGLSLGQAVVAGMRHAGFTGQF